MNVLVYRKTLFEKAVLKKFTKNGHCVSLNKLLGQIKTTWLMLGINFIEACSIIGYFFQIVHF